MAINFPDTILTTLYYDNYYNHSIVTLSLSITFKYKSNAAGEYDCFPVYYEYDCFPVYYIHVTVVPSAYFDLAHP